MSSSLEGRSVIVTGAGRNVGEAISRELAARGARVAVVDIDKGSADRVAKVVNAEHPDAAVALAADVSSPADVQRMVDDAWERLGAVDTLVNCVAITDRPTTVLELPDDRWDQVLRVTLSSAFLTTKYVARRMVDAGASGVIIHIGSTSGSFARRNAIAYPTAKAGLYALTRSMALQLGGHGIRVNTVSPNKVGSPVGQAEEPASRPRNNLLGRACTPQDIAGAVAFMVSDEAGFVTGTDLLVDGGALIASGD
jgi:NAD(P)-dependent dehydrogenase (short-subunit alcohol dehydrogenase family)